MKAKIIGVSRAVDASQLAKARAFITSRGSLQPGELVSVIVHAKGLPNTSNTAQQWSLPTRALTQWRGQTWVFLANEKGFEAKKVAVKSATEENSIMELSLPAGSKVAITGIASLRALLQKDE
jgi:hypothetical protein